jgi:hypothetical protein
MSNPESQANEFYKQVAASRIVWTIRDEAGIPVPESDGIRAMPFWSSFSRAELIIQTVPDYSGFSPMEISWQDFKDKWGPGLTKDGVLAGVNWSGSTASGFDLYPEELIKNVETAIRNSL